jgi:hypothetical protein
VGGDWLDSGQDGVPSAVSHTEEGIASQNFRLMAKQRLKQMQREIFEQVAVVI